MSSNAAQYPKRALWNALFSGMVGALAASGVWMAIAASYRDLPEKSLRLQHEILRLDADVFSLTEQIEELETIVKDLPDLSTVVRYGDKIVIGSSKNPQKVLSGNNVQANSNSALLHTDRVTAAAFDRVYETLSSTTAIDDWAGAGLYGGYSPHDFKYAGTAMLSSRDQVWILGRSE